MSTIKRLLKLPQKAHFFLFGPRQVGKSSLLRENFPEDCTTYFDLLSIKEYTKYVANPHLLREEVEALGKNISHVVIDEIQKIPELLDEIHYLIESVKTPIYFCLSGSSARKIKRAKANMLGGRAWTRHLFPLTHIELGEDFKLGRALHFGTLPSVYLSDDERANEILMSYVETYLEEEIRAEAIVRNIGAFVRFLKFAAHENGSILNFSNIAKDTGVSYKTVKEYFQILEDTLLGFFLMPYSRSQRKRLIQHPKFYLFDTGVRNALAKRLSVELEPRTKDYGLAFEHFIITEFHRLNKYYKKDYEFSFYRSSAGAEVDLIIESPDKTIYAIEIKSSEIPTASDLRGLKSFQEIHAQAKLICLSRANHKRKIGDVMIYPWQKVFELLGFPNKLCS